MVASPSLQNIVGVVREFSRVMANQAERRAQGLPAEEPEESVGRGTVYFDVLGRFMLAYDHRTALIFHSLPLFLLLPLAPWLLRNKVSAAAAAQSGKGAYLGPALRSLGAAAAGMLGSLLLPAALAMVHVTWSGKPMLWFSRPWLLPVLFSPAAMAGLLIPYCMALDQDLTTALFGEGCLGSDSPGFTPER